MKRITIIFAALLAFVLTGCKDLDLSPFEQRLSKLEETLNAITSAQNGGDYITDVTELKDAEGNVVGYQITFKEHGTVVVRNGAKGDPGNDGVGTPGKDGDAFFKSVEVGDGFVTFETEDGKKFVVPMQSAFSLQIGTKDFDAVEPNQEITIPYTITGGDANTTVSVLTAGGYKAVVEDGKIVVTAPALPGDAQLLVIADNGAGKTGTVVLNFTAGVISLSVADFQLAAKGNGEVLATTMNVAAPVNVLAPEWAKVTVSGKDVSIQVAANPDSKNARHGKVVLSAVVNGEATSAEILLAQAAAGCNVAFDSFAGSLLDANWKGDIAGSEAHLSDGALVLHGDSGDRYNPLFFYGAKIRRQAADDSYNTVICTVDIKADGGEGGIQLFNTNGYDGGAYNFDMPNYRYFTSAGAGSTGGGFYGFNKGGLAAADGWNCAVGTVTEWIRLEISNVDRGKTEHSLNPDWGAAYIWSLEPDENGVLQPKDILWAKEMWWWNDGDNQPRKDYGYAAVWGRSGNNVSIKNFTLSYTDK